MLICLRVQAMMLMVVIIYNDDSISQHLLKL